jgi:hypothetical protein
MSNSIYQAFGNVRISEDNLVIEVMNSTGVDIEGSSNLVILDSDNINGAITGSGNTMLGSGASTSWCTLFAGTENIVSLGDGSTIDDQTLEGGNAFTVGDNGDVRASKNDTIYAGAGSDVRFGDGDVISTNSSHIHTSFVFNSRSSDIIVNGDANRIEVEGGTLVLNGANNNITASTYAARPTYSVGSRSVEETITTSTGSVVADVNGMVLTGSANGANITLTGGVATVNLGNGNIVTLSGISSGATVKYIDASGATTVSTLTDDNVENIGGTLYNVSGNATVGQDNAFFDVLNSNAALNVAGSGNTVVLEENGNRVTVAGNGNTFLGSGGATALVSGFDNFFSLGDQAAFSVYGNGNTLLGGDNSGGALTGSNNVLSIGDDGNVIDRGDGNVITFGDRALMSSSDAHATITAGANGNLLLWNGGTVNASNGNRITYLGGDGSISGDSNYINFEGDNLKVTGSNNSISMPSVFYEHLVWGQKHDAQTITTDTGSLHSLGTEIVITGSVKVTSVTLGAGGVATIDLGNGNIVTLSGVSSGTSVKYIDNSGAASVATLTDPSLLHVSGTLYNVKSDIYTAQSKSILDVFSGASLYLTGSSDQVILESGSHGGYVFGDKNTIVGTKVSGVVEAITGNGNVAQFGANNTIFNYGVGNTITVGANSVVWDTATEFLDHTSSSTTINATQGGAQITVRGTGEAINANSAEITERWLSKLSYSSSIKGNGNLIDVDCPPGQEPLNSMVLSLNGSNNMIHLYSANGGTIKTTTGSLIAKSNELVLTGTADASSIYLLNGSATVNLGSGNVITLDGVYSGANVEYIDASGKATWSVLQDSSAGVSATRSLGATSGTQADAQVNQLVAAMASYSVGSGGVGASAQMSPNANVQPLAASAVLH